MVATASLLSFVLALSPQNPGDPGPDAPVATYVLDGKPATVTRTDLALYLAFQLRRRDEGQQATEQLVAATLTRQAAARQNLMPTEPEIRAFWRDLQEQLRAAGKKPEDIPAVRNSSEAEWFDSLATQLAQQQLVRKELGLAPKAEVSGDMLSLWLQEERKKHTIVTDPDALPAGTAIRIDTTDVPMLDLGLLLFRTSDDAELLRFAKEVAYLNVLDSVARAAGVTLTADDFDRGVKRAQDAARDRRYSGVSFESMLKQLGLTVSALRELRTFRGQVLLDKLAQQRFPDASLAKRLEQDRQGVLDVVGPRRRIGLIFVRALDVPNGLITRTFDQAKEHLEGVRARLAKESFETVARIESEHVSTKTQGGDAGWHRRKSERLPEPILGAAFALRAGEVSMPMQTDDGVCLVKTLDIEPAPADAVLLTRLREHEAQELSQRMLADAKVEFVKNGGGK